MFCINNKIFTILNILYTLFILIYFLINKANFMFLSNIGILSTIPYFYNYYNLKKGGFIMENIEKNVQNVESKIKYRIY